jgi:hypothetical protein
VANRRHSARRIKRLRSYDVLEAAKASHEDARQIAENVTGFFAILAEWSRAEMPVPANDTGELSISDTGDVRREQKAGGGWTARCPVHDECLHS